VLVEQPFHTAIFVCKQQIPGTDKEGEERERPGDKRTDRQETRREKTSSGQS